jgi:diguanylate cyclase (GGDEF)-like protein
MRLSTERILLIGDQDRQVQTALQQTLPGAQINSVGGMFDGIAELAGGGYSTILAAAEPIERRPEAAVKTLRQLAGEAKLMLFGHPTLEPLSRKMLSFGCDDYIITPASPEELGQMFGSPPLQLSPVSNTQESLEIAGAIAQPSSRASQLLGLPIAEILLDAMMQHPHDSPTAAVRQINALIGPTMKIALTALNAPAPAMPEGSVIISHLLRSENQDSGALHLILPRDEEEAPARHFLAQLAGLLGKAVSLRDRHNRMQQLAITDELTGLYNGRYFKHFLNKIIEKARSMRFSVTLLLFDIDDFKRYNDQFGHGVGDEILRQTAALMRRCCREHDKVCRISGDEFAVIFWEKEGPRQPREQNASPITRVPNSVRAVCERFKRLISSPDFAVLGNTGKGTLTISGALAVYPFDAQTPEALIEAADHELMFGAKKSGKNSILLVGDETPDPPNP